MDGGYFLYDSTERDVEQLTLMLTSWIGVHRKRFWDLGDRLTVNDRVLFAHAYDDDIFVSLNVFGRDANACKRAAIILMALCRHMPIQIRPNRGQTQLSESEDRLLRLINAEAAFEVAGEYATCAHEDAGGQWSFVKLPKFPSLHSYIDFIAGLATIRDMHFDATCAHTRRFFITRLSLLLELCFYRTNPEIAGRTDPKFWKEILDKNLGFSEFGLLDLTLNADDKCKLPKNYHDRVPRTNG